jgi:DNA helicase-2/ATP-dependent DNA helicase PcrA
VSCGFYPSAAVNYGGFEVFMIRDQEFLSAKRTALGMYFSHLNDMQKQAVFTVQGPVLVLAGAGSGKTSVLVNRIANMVNFGNAYAEEQCPPSVSEDDISFLNNYKGERDEENVSRLRDIVAVNKVDPWKIMAITFTNKAAGELKERLSSMLGDDGNDILAATFHSVCVRILRREIDKLGYEKDFTIYDSDDSQRLLKSCYEPLDLSDKVFAPKAVLSEISHAKDNLVSPEEFESDAAGDYRKSGVAKLYKAYQSRLKSANAVDFDDIIRLTVEIFEKFPDVREHYSNRYKYIMVDEYQDTNFAQLRLCTLLSSEHRNICVVGDDDQSIYKFRGATIENILKFEEQFDGAAVIRLEQNYRSTQNILNAANSIIQNNTERNSKKLWTDSGDGEKITIYKASDESTESGYVAEVIQDGVKEGKTYKDYAILYRMNAQSNSLERAFASRGIPYRVIGGQRFYDRKEIRDMIAYLSVLNNDMDMLRFKRIINEPKRGIGDTTVSMIEQMSADMGISPFEVMENAESYPMLAKKSASLVKISSMFKHLREFSETAPLDKLLDELLDKTGYALYMRSLGDEGIARMENINELKSTMAEYMNGKAEGEEYSLSEFLEEISLFTDIDKMDDEADAVNMMTVHSAKGLEFDTVFIVGMEDGIFPGVRSMDTLENLEEERRLAYVAITRAKRKLYITHAQQRMLFGQTNRNLVSRFVKEIPAEYADKIDSTVKIRQATEDDVIVRNTKAYTLQGQIANKKIEQAKRNHSVDYEVGERVHHNIFGDGTILSVKKMSNDAMLEIAFETVGTKKVMANFAKIQKI